MKLIGKNILACAVGAGLLTFATSRAQAVSYGDDFQTTFNAQLIIKWSDSNGKAQKARITTKDLVTAISEDFDENYSGDKIIYDYYDADEFDEGYWLVDKHNNFVLDLSDYDEEDDYILLADYDQLSSSEKDGKNDSYKYTETGVADFEFYSDGDDGDVSDNTLAFVDDEVSYTYSENVGPLKKGLQQVSITEKDGLNGDGVDYDVVDFDDLPIFGIITQNGSGKSDWFD
jgi:hypothetical protein